MWTQRRPYERIYPGDRMLYRGKVFTVSSWRVTAWGQVEYSFADARFNVLLWPSQMPEIVCDEEVTAE